MEVFDVAETDRTTPVRFASTQPTQALGMMNSAFLQNLGEAAAKKAMANATGQPQQVAALYRQVLARNPSELWRVVDEYDVSMCGFIPTTAMLVAANALGAMVEWAATTGNLGLFRDLLALLPERAWHHEGE